MKKGEILNFRNGTKMDRKSNNIHTIHVHATMIHNFIKIILLTPMEAYSKTEEWT